SGSNWIVLRALALERQDAVVLVARSIHHSVINALKAYGLALRLLPTPYEPRYEALLPPSVDQVVEGLRRAPEAAAVFYTSPTSEGLSADTRGGVPPVAALRGSRGGHAGGRRGGPRAVAPRDGGGRRGLGRPPALPPRAARVGDG